MRLVNDLVVRGEPAEIDHLVDRFGDATCEGGWRREPKVEASLQQWGIGKHGVYCFSRGELSGLPPVSFYLCRTAADQLSSSSVIPGRRQPLTDEQHNQVIEDFRAQVLSPISEGHEVGIETVPPRLNRLEWSLSPEALRRLSYFATMNANRAVLTPEDRSHWRDFGFQVDSDGSMLETQDLVEWLAGHGWSEADIRGLVARLDVERTLEHRGLGI